MGAGRAGGAKWKRPPEGGPSTLFSYRPEVMSLTYERENTAQVLSFGEGTSLTKREGRRGESAVNGPPAVFGGVVFTPPPTSGSAGC
jgi:hypothetical protein